MLRAQQGTAPPAPAHSSLGNACRGPHGRSRTAHRELGLKLRGACVSPESAEELSRWWARALHKLLSTGQGSESSGDTEGRSQVRLWPYSCRLACPVTDAWMRYAKSPFWSHTESPGCSLGSSRLRCLPGNPVEFPGAPTTPGRSPSQTHSQERAAPTLPLAQHRDAPRS